ncbi:ribosomal protein L22e [Neocallimastix californiae]|uniref:Large ribosomal subunit protein eL22 n=1 Tax=Neocallimastix californiae TaxID=1754190 RepID=A0A1Y2ETX1_9FUNG|nr:ribosomal protein L22e [Neocallimastix californiae]|eukprot:ORY74967.1 ribosomal protein L22e [Neocallimastix californiae]
MAPAKVVKKENVFTIDCSGPAADGILDTSSLENYLVTRIKVEGRTNNFGNNIKVTRSNNEIKVTVSPNIQFSKRYIKYLTKKYLKKSSLRDWLRVVASSKSAYEIRYYNVDQGVDEE